ncbi:MAG: triose-phosphate isomerase [Candidatus Falkowbacteria bacterium]|nr:triose-phosphate isomerase [Candidatus Falkowbacteria bacterium]
MYLIANWKMNLSVKDSIALANEYVRLFKKTNAEIVACPSFTSLPFVCKALEKTNLAVGAQDVFWEAKGAFTGEVSPDDLVELGASYVIIGHSERRGYLGEEDWMINQKVKAALAARHLNPILCIGETKEDHDNGDREEVLSRQLDEALNGVSLGLNQNLLVAYEPIWAIGTGEVPEPEEISYVNDVIRVLLRRYFGDRSDRACAVIYGGSVDEKTVQPIMETGIDGFLVGGASLKAREFNRLAEHILK